MSSIDMGPAAQREAKRRVTRIEVSVEGAGGICHESEQISPPGNYLVVGVACLSDPAACLDSVAGLGRAR
jgi:hypothetical protein